MEWTILTISPNRHLTVQSSLHRPIVTTPSHRHYTVQSLLDHLLVTRPSNRHQLDRPLATRPSDPHQTIRPSLDRPIVTTPFHRPIQALTHNFSFADRRVHSLSRGGSPGRLARGGVPELEGGEEGLQGGHRGVHADAALRQGVPVHGEWLLYTGCLKEDRCCTGCSKKIE